MTKEHSVDENIRTETLLCQRIPKLLSTMQNSIRDVPIPNEHGEEHREGHRVEHGEERRVGVVSLNRFVYEPMLVPSPFVTVYVHPASALRAGEELRLTVSSRTVGEIRKVFFEILKMDAFILLYKDSIVGTDVYIMDNSPIHLYVPHYKHSLRDRHSVCVCKKETLPISDEDEYLRYYSLGSKCIVMDLLVLTIKSKDDSYYLGRDVINTFLQRRLDTYYPNSIFMPYFTPEGFSLQVKRSNNVKVPIQLKIKSMLIGNKNIGVDTLTVVVRMSDTVNRFMVGIKENTQRLLARAGISCVLKYLWYNLYHERDRIYAYDKRKMYEFKNHTDFIVYVGSKSRSPCHSVLRSTSRLVSHSASYSTSRPISRSPRCGSSPSQGETIRTNKEQSGTISQCASGVLNEEMRNLNDSSNLSMSIDIKTLAPSLAEITGNVRMYSYRTISIRGTEGMSILTGAIRSIYVYNYDTVGRLLTLYRQALSWEMEKVPTHLALLDRKGRQISSKTLVANIETLVDVVGSS